MFKRIEKNALVLYFILFLRLYASIPAALLQRFLPSFEAEELLLPQLLANNAPINKLAAYAAWNTFSNSSGTALAQGLIFAGRLRELRR